MKGQKLSATGAAPRPFANLHLPLVCPLTAEEGKGEGRSSSFCFAFGRSLSVPVHTSVVKTISFQPPFQRKTGCKIRRLTHFNQIKPRWAKLNVSLEKNYEHPQSHRHTTHRRQSCAIVTIRAPYPPVKSS
jgi:hypothetical protein